MKFYKDKNKNIFEKDDEIIVDKNFVEISEEEYNRLLMIYKEIAELKFNLKKTDYKAIKHSEGLISEEEYLPFKTLRQGYRDRINYLLEELNN